MSRHRMRADLASFELEMLRVRQYLDMRRKRTPVSHGSLKTGEEPGKALYATTLRILDYEIKVINERVEELAQPDDDHCPDCGGGFKEHNAVNYARGYGLVAHSAAGGACWKSADSTFVQRLLDSKILQTPESITTGGTR